MLEGQARRRSHRRVVHARPPRTRR
jgi:hypothetical protein